MRVIKTPLLYEGRHAGIILCGGSRENPNHAGARVFPFSYKARFFSPRHRENTEEDAAHLALAAFHGMEYLATWNQTHLDNPHLRDKIRKVIKEQGFSPSLVLTPERLLEMDHD